MDIWNSKRWRKILPPDCRNGLRARFDPGVDGEIRRYCLLACDWLRFYYDFPIRLPVYFRNAESIRAKDGDRCSGIFYAPFDHRDEPYIRIALGNYAKRKSTWGKEYAVAAAVLDIFHEVTHYYQWINGLELTPRGKEWQATWYAKNAHEDFFRECLPDMYAALYAI